MIRNDSIEIAMDVLLRRAFSTFPTGVVAVCALDSDGVTPIGMAVNSFTSISLEPALVAISVANTSRTWPGLSRSQSLGLSVLGSGHEHVSRSLSARDGDRFGELSWSAKEGGAIHLDGSALWLSCHLEQTIEAGDHAIVILAIDDLTHFDDVEPLVFHQSRYRSISA